MDLRKLVYIETVNIVNIFDIYKTWDVKIPDGYKVIDFRLPKKGDIVFNKEYVVETTFSNWSAPRLILEKIKKKVKVLRPVRNDYTFKKGEYYQERIAWTAYPTHFIPVSYDWEDHGKNSTGTAYELIEEDFPS